MRAAAAGADAEILRVAGEALTALRKVKSENKVSQRTTYAAVSIEVAEADRARLDAVHADLVRAAHVRGDLSARSVEGDAPVAVVSYQLDPPEPKKPASAQKA